MKSLKKILNSIALVPSVLALCFLVFALALLLIEVDYESVPILKKVCFSEKSDVQFVLAFLIGGIFTLTIFSYTMVMNVLNRNINNYSPRLIPLLLSEKHHQTILGFTSGTIIYAMTMAVAINSPNIEYFPGIAGSIGVFFGIACIILFIYFIHSVSKSIHINYIVKESFLKTMSNIDRLTAKAKYLEIIDAKNESFVTQIKSQKCGYLKMPDLDLVERFMIKHKVNIKLLKYPGVFVQKGETYVAIDEKSRKIKESDIHDLFVLDYTVSMDVIETGFKHLVEVAVKAMSPAINDPGTALTALDYLSQLFKERATMTNFNCYKSRNRIFIFSLVPYAKLHDFVFRELEHYLKNDPILKDRLLEIYKKTQIVEVFDDIDFN